MTTPADFWSKEDGFLVGKLAKKIANGLAIGPDGDFWLYEGGVFRPAPHVVRNRMVEHLGNRYRSGLVTSVEDVLRAIGLPVLPSSPEYGSWYEWINLKNGMYNWKTDHFEAHNPRFMSTVQLPIEYDRNAKCPAFNSWLDEVVPGDMNELMWEVTGYILMTGNPKQTAILLHGPEGTGKSTKMRVWECLLGRENISAQSLKSLTENRFAASSLFMKTANILGDIDASYMRDSSLFKAITGGDTFTAERKYKDGFEFRPFAVPIFSANKTWQSLDDTGGYFRRWVVLPFTQKVDRSKPFDERDLYAESAGIFNRAMGALRELKARGEFDIRGTAREAREKFEEDSDPLRFWLSEDKSIQADRGNESYRVNRTHLHTQYMLWCKDNGYTYIRNAGEFYKSLEALGYELKTSNNTRYVIGIEQFIPGMRGVNA